jgi:hypothetical protein
MTRIADCAEKVAIALFGFVKLGTSGDKKKTGP